MNTKAHPLVLDGVFSINPSAREKQHQVGKPLALMEQLMRIVPPASTVLDPFAGSATTGVAAIQAGHRFIGMEMAEGYHQVAIGRLRAAAN
jgi:site-specific DNA-methyltransferase (adenine-specific)